jgi:membrane-bound lytic murein transglycosylase B
VTIFQTSLAAALIATCALQADAAVKKPTQRASLSKTQAMAVRPSKAVGPVYARRADVMQQADAIARTRALDRDWVRRAIGRAHFMPGVAKAILPPPVGVPKNWAAYQARFVEPVRIRAGIRFWQANRDTLQRAEAETGVPASIIVGIIGVETIYGQNTGNFRVMDALSTLAFDFPANHPKADARSQFFRAELEEYLALTARTQTDPLALRGSYAGAMGWPQFMPSSWSKYAIDFDGDGRIDLFNSQADVIGSVANYFKAFHWQPGMATHYAVHFDPASLDKAALLLDILPSFTLAELAAKGVLLDAPGDQHKGPLALIELQNGDDAPQYVAGTENFYTITRYNWSSYYAMAVIELGQAVEKTMAQTLATAPDGAPAAPPAVTK